MYDVPTEKLTEGISLLNANSDTLLSSILINCHFLFSSINGVAEWQGVVLLEVISIAEIGLIASEVLIMVDLWHLHPIKANVNKSV